MSLLFFAYANNALQPLPRLSEEEEQVYQLLQGLESADYKVKKESNSTLELLINRLDLFQKEIILFCYSGHAGSESLETLHGPAYARGLSGLLGDCIHLHLVVLNGCYT